MGPRIVSVQTNPDLGLNSCWWPLVQANQKQFPPQIQQQNCLVEWSEGPWSPPHYCQVRHYRPRSCW